MNFSISLELGPKYEVTYLDGSKIIFKVLGGPNTEVFVLDNADGETSTVSAILQNLKSIVKVDE